MKAYELSSGETPIISIVFGDNIREVKKFISDFMHDENIKKYTSVRIKRAKDFDGMEEAYCFEMDKRFWELGRPILDDFGEPYDDIPDRKTATAVDFKGWWIKNRLELFGDYGTIRIW